MQWVEWDERNRSSWPSQQVVLVWLKDGTFTDADFVASDDGQPFFTRGGDGLWGLVTHWVNVPAPAEAS